MDVSMLRRNGFRWTLCLMGAAALPLTACGSDNSQPGYAKSAHIECGGKQSLTASGSTAQANAIPVFVQAFTAACPGQTVVYTSNGSGAGGVSEFLSKKTDFGGSDSALSQERGEYAAAQQRCGSPAWNIPRGVRADRDHLQPQRCADAGARWPHGREDFSTEGSPAGMIRRSRR